MKKSNLLLIAILSLVVSVSFAQTTDSRDHYSRNSFWTETLFNGPVKGKFKWQLDFQWRKTSDPSNSVGGSSNMFTNSYQHVYRPWLHYQLTDNIRLSLSPIGLWETYTGTVESGGSKKVQPELRVCPQLTITNKFFDRVTIDQRYRYEFRYFGNKVDTDRSEFTDYSASTEYNLKKQRLRYFVRATIPLNHKTLEKNTFYIVAWNEIFMGLGKNTANDKLWDQNRTFCLLGYKPKWDRPMRFELGYGMVVKNNFSSKIDTEGNFVETGHLIERNNVLQVYVIFENMNKLFKKDQPKPAETK